MTDIEDDILVRHFIDLAHRMSVWNSSSDDSWQFAKKIALELGEYEIWFLQNIIRHYENEEIANARMIR